MVYLFAGIFVYLAVGLYLTRSLTVGAPSLRMGFTDAVLGAVLMPVVIAFGLLCILFDILWKRLMIALDLDPPEEMRAGPEAPASDELEDL